MSFDSQKTKLALERFGKASFGDQKALLKFAREMWEQMPGAVQRIEELDALKVSHEEQLRYEREMVASYRNNNLAYYREIQTKDARIKQLEEALIEERAQLLFYSPDDEGHLPIFDWNELGDDSADKIREQAQEQLQKEGLVS